MEDAPGPLDELFPGARARRADDLPSSPVHPRVLEVRDAPDVAAFAIVVWPEAEDGPELRSALKQVIEATLLAELSRTPMDLAGDGARRVGSLRVVAFTPIDPAALRPFGLELQAGMDVPGEGSDWKETLAHVRGEASAYGREVPETDPLLFRAVFAQNEGLMPAERTLRAVGEEAIFGARPGALARHVAGRVGLDDPGDLDGMAAALVPSVEERVRWVEPMLFQSLCDAAGVHAARHLGLEVQWAVSEPDDDAMAPPPLLRAQTPAGDVHVPVGLELLRWCVMPLRRGEEVPTLTEWCRDRFGVARFEA